MTVTRTPRATEGHTGFTFVPRPGRRRVPLQPEHIATAGGSLAVAIPLALRHVSHLPSQTAQ